MVITKKFTLESSHILPKHTGKCANLHGHSWQITIAIQGKVDPETSYVLDYAILSKIVSPLIERLDHTHLNYFIPYPSAERIAAFFGSALDQMITRELTERLEVTIAETQGTTAVWNSNSPADIELMHTVRTACNELWTDDAASDLFPVGGPHETINRVGIKQLHNSMRMVLEQVQLHIVKYAE